MKSCTRTNHPGDPQSGHCSCVLECR